MDQHSVYLLDPDPHSEKRVDPDPDPQKMNADPQPCAYVDSGARSAACGAAQGEAAAILAQGHTLLVHSGVVYIKQALLGPLQAAV